MLAALVEALHRELTRLASVQQKLLEDLEQKAAAIQMDAEALNLEAHPAAYAN
jgi:hypothetical protein